MVLHFIYIYILEVSSMLKTSQFFLRNVLSKEMKTTILGSQASSQGFDLRLVASFRNFIRRDLEVVEGL